MENENVEPQVVEETPVVEETTEETPVMEVPQEETVTLKKSDYNKLNRKAIAYETNKIKPIITSPEGSLDSIDLIKLGKKLTGFSDEEIDFATEVAKSKKPEDILKALDNPFVVAGIKSNREKVEKERLTLKPSATQSESDEPISLEEALKTANEAEKEELLIKAGLYSAPYKRTDRFNADRLTGRA